MTHTKATDKLPAIDWEMMGVIERDLEERMVIKLALGTDEDSNLYHGSAEYCCGELIEIRDIQEI